MLRQPSLEALDHVAEELDSVPHRIWSPGDVGLRHLLRVAEHGLEFGVSGVEVSDGFGMLLFKVVDGLLMLVPVRLWIIFCFRPLGPLELLPAIAGVVHFPRRSSGRLA